MPSNIHTTQIRRCSQGQHSKTKPIEIITSYRAPTSLLHSLKELRAWLFWWIMGARRPSHVTGLQPPVVWVGSDGVQAIGTTRDLGEGRPLSRHSMLRGVARRWSLLAKYGCAPPWKVVLSSGASYSSTGGARGSAAVGCCCARGTSSSFSCRPADEHCTGVLAETERVAYCLLKTERD